jgi:beta-xylosidase
MVKASRIIKQLAPQTQVGGCGHNTTMPSAVFSGILDMMERENFTPDFISICVYPYVRSDAQFVVSADPHFAVHKLDDLHGILSKRRKLTQRLFITSIGADISARNYVNDTCHQAAFVIKQTADLLERAEVLGYWQLSDLGTSYTDTNRLLFGGNGLLSKDGIKKPGFAALEMLRDVSPNLIKKGDGWFAATNTRNVHYLVLYNYAHFNEVYRVSRGSRVTLTAAYSSFQDTQTKEYNIILNNLTSGNYKIITVTLSRSHGSLLDAWMEYGLLDDLRPKELQYFRDAVHPKQTAQYINCNDGTLTLQAQLLPHEIKVITFIHEI